MRTTGRADQLDLRARRPPGKPVSRGRRAGGLPRWTLKRAIPRPSRVTFAAGPDPRLPSPRCPPTIVITKGWNDQLLGRYDSTGAMLAARLAGSLWSPGRSLRAHPAGQG